MILFNFIRQIDEYNKIDDYCARFQETYEDIREKTSLYVARLRFVNDLKLATQLQCTQSFIQTQQFDYKMNLNALQIATINFEKVHVEIYIQRNNKRDVVTNIFIANINVDAQDNFNYMKDDFVNRERDDRENDRESRKDINVDQIFKVCYNCDSYHDARSKDLLNCSIFVKSSSRYSVFISSHFK